MNRFRGLFSFYLPIAPQRMTYMLQSVEYDWRRFALWCFKLPELHRLTKRGNLTYTAKAKALLLAAYSVYIAMFVGGIFLTLFQLIGLLILLLMPGAVIAVLCCVSALGSAAVKLKRRGLISQAQQQLATSKSIRIAVLGSYGKTTMKELLLAVLGGVKNVKATPGNLNVPISHARWITSELDGSEDIVVLEYGEGSPGDTAHFIELTSPEYAVLTGIAPNHLDRYPDYDALKADLSVIANKISPKKLFVNVQAAGELKLSDVITYSEDTVGDWHISNISVGYDGTRFTIANTGKKIELHSHLVGRHQVGPIAAVVQLALQLGLTIEEVKTGVSQATIFPHRMQPRELHGAWIIDDTYNGNFEGIKAGIELMKELPATRKIYVTPGLVDQGVETERVHNEIGKLIAKANPDQVVLMKNSVTKLIQTGLTEAGFAGDVQIETDPKGYYASLEHRIAAGDLYMLQNDWPDQYS